MQVFSALRQPVLDSMQVPQGVPVTVVLLEQAVKHSL
jgi:hypothetical protein